jgi:hypothetical protein
MTNNRTIQFLQYLKEVNHSHLRLNLTSNTTTVNSTHSTSRTETLPDDNIVIPFVFLIVFLFCFFDYAERMRRSMPRQNVSNFDEGKYSQNIWVPRYFHHYSPTSRTSEGFHALRSERPEIRPEIRVEESKIYM